MTRTSGTTALGARHGLGARRGLAVALALPLALALAACGNSTGAGGSPSVATPTAPYNGPSPEPTVGTQTVPPPSADPASALPETLPPPPSAAPVAAPSVAPMGAGALPGVPAVEGAADVMKEPKVAAGTGPVGAGLVIRDLVVGSGAEAAPGATVSVRYVGAIYATAKVFDASWKSGTMPVQFSLAQVIPGFADGIPGMKVGGRREIVIPPGPLGYEGGNPQAGIGADDALVFIVDLAETAPASR